MKRFMRITVAFACGFVACLCWWFFSDCGVEPQVKDRVPTLAEVQKMVGATPDGVYGPETAAKWDSAVCQQYSDEYNHYYERIEK